MIVTWLAVARSPLSPPVAVVVVFGVLAVGVWLTLVLEELFGRLVAGRSVRAGGLLVAPLRRAALLLVQAPTSTERLDGPAWVLGACGLGALAACALVVVPLSRSVAPADLSSGIVLFGAAIALVMVMVFLHGWSPNSVLPLIGGYRFAAQALSYEMPLALVLIAVALPAQSLAVGAIVTSQRGLWNVVRQPLGLPLYLVAATGVAFWGPLNTPDAADLSGGTTVEVAGSALLVWELSRAAVLVATAAMGVACFLGGWWGPALPGPVWVAVKTALFLAVMVGAGHLLARVRLERFVVTAWAVLIPLALVDVFAGGVVALK
jgi:NADH-quinone oxidoreductase subunit H